MQFPGIGSAVIIADAKGGEICICNFIAWSLSLVATLFDAKSYRIPNQLIILGLTASLMLNVFDQGPTGGLLFITRVLIAFIALYVFYLLNVWGAGDLKLAIFLASLLGMEMAGKIMIVSVFLATAVIIAVSLYRGKLMKNKLHYSYYISAAILFCQIVPVQF